MREQRERDVLGMATLQSENGHPLRMPVAEFRTNFLVRDLRPGADCSRVGGQN
jgi:hypothetical protein